MKALIGNHHNSSFGGGEYYSYQIAKAISNYCDILYINKPNEVLLKNNKDLIHKYDLYKNNESVDFYFHIGHHNPELKGSIGKNVYIVFFPNKNFDVKGYGDIVTICDFSKKYVKEYWGREAKVCKPYSKSIIKKEKIEGNIVSIGNFFYEGDGHSKNQHLLIDTFKKMVDNGFKGKLTLIGSIVNNEYYNKCKSESQGYNISVYGNCSESVKIDVLSKAEFYWHANGYGRKDPYQTEHFGIAPEEGIKAGCLTYVHNSGGAKEFCKTYDTFEQLVDMTLNKEPNIENIENTFQTKIKMDEFWKGFLNG